jgi:hypothetical protein
MSIKHGDRAIHLSFRMVTKKMALTMIRRLRGSLSRKRQGRLEHWGKHAF